MKWICSILFVSILSVSFAQNKTEQKISDNVTLTTEVDLDFVIETHTKKNQKTDEKNGYRIQIIYNTNRDEVYAKKAKVYQEFTEFKSYIIYDQPYYKLRIGDFETRIEARKYLEDILVNFPTAFIVKDVIKIK